MSDNFEFKHIVYFQIFLPFAINLDPYIKKVSFELDKDEFCIQLMQE